MLVSTRVMQFCERVHQIHIDDILEHQYFIYRLYSINITIEETMRDIFGNSVVFCIFANRVIYSTGVCY